MESKFKSGILIAGLAVITSLLLMSMVFSGCVNSAQPQGQSAISAAQPASGQPAGSPAAPAQTAIDKSKTEASSNKTGIDKTNEAIKLALADGTYAQEVAYKSPGGEDHITISLSVKGDVVESASITAVGQLDPKSTKFVSNVNSKLPALVVGKKITEVSLSNQTTGSSLTTAAFNGYVASLLGKQ